MPLRDFRTAHHGCWGDYPELVAFNKAIERFHQVGLAHDRITSENVTRLRELDMYIGTDHAYFCSEKNIDMQADDSRRTMAMAFSSDRWLNLSGQQVDALQAVCTTANAALDQIVERGKRELIANPNPEDRQEKHKGPSIFSGLR